MRTRANIRVLRYVPRFLAMAWETHRGYAVGVVAVRMMRAFVPAAALWVGKLIIDTVVQGIAAVAAGDAAPWPILARLILLEFAIAVLSEALARTSALLESMLSDRFTTRVTARIMRHAARLDLAQLETPKIYDELERARRQAVGRVGLLGLLLGTAQDLISLLSLTAVLLAYSPWLLGLLAVAVVPAFVGEAHFAALGYSLLYRWTPERRRLDYLSLLATSKEPFKEIKLWHLGGLLVDRYSHLADAFNAANRTMARRRAVVAILLTSVGTLGYYSAYTIVIYLTIVGYVAPAGPFTIGVLTFLAGSFRHSRDLIQRVLFALAQMYEQALYLEDLFGFLATRPRLRSPARAQAVPRPAQVGFRFEDVGFRYAGADDWAVRGVSFTLSPGERIAIVGENGSGKTTVLKLLTRLYDPDEGRVLLDDVDLREYDLEELRQNFSVVFQDFVRFDFELRENIKVSDPSIQPGNPRFREAARRSLAHDVAQRLPKGYRQQLGRRFEGGVDLSGGEWQRVALARGYLRDSQILVLDEPTAALDARGECHLHRHFAGLTRDKMAIVVSHRFSTVRMADRAIVLVKGQIAEEGVHEELVTRGGPYAELFGLQAASYLR